MLVLEPINIYIYIQTEFQFELVGVIFDKNKYIYIGLLIKHWLFLLISIQKNIHIYASISLLGACMCVEGVELLRRGDLSHAIAQKVASYLQKLP